VLKASVNCYTKHKHHSIPFKISLKQSTYTTVKTELQRSLRQGFFLTVCILTPFFQVKKKNYL